MPASKGRNDVLGEILVGRGWVKVIHDHPEDTWDMWEWPPSAPEGDSYAAATSIHLEHDSYVVHYADMTGDEVFDYFDSREELLADINSIENFRDPEDPRASWLI